MRVRKRRNTLEINNKQQFIFRLYKSPAEIVYGFDVDCCGFLYDGTNVYATERAYYAWKNKINHFDFDRMSKSYSYRLAKYSGRGFKIWLPFFDERKVNLEKMLSKIEVGYRTDKKFEELIYDFIYNSETFYYNRDRLHKYFMDYFNGYEEIYLLELVSAEISHFLLKGEERLKKLIRELLIVLLTHLNTDKKVLKKFFTPQRALFSAILFGIYASGFYKTNNLDSDYKEIKKNFNVINRKRDETFGFRRRVSISRKSKKLPYIFKASNYIQTNNKDIYNYLNGEIKDKEAIKLFQESFDIKWKTQNPMEQLTGTFNPQKITDIIKWYKDSGVYDL